MHVQNGPFVRERTDKITIASPAHARLHLVRVTYACMPSDGHLTARPRAHVHSSTHTYVYDAGELRRRSTPLRHAQLSLTICCLLLLILASARTNEYKTVFCTLYDDNGAARRARIALLRCAASTTTPPPLLPPPPPQRQCVDRGPWRPVAVAVVFVVADVVSSSSAGQFA